MEWQGGEPVGLRFTGFSAVLPFGVYRTSGASEPVDFDTKHRLQEFRERLITPLRLVVDSMFFCGFRVANVDGGVQVEVNGRGLDAGEAISLPYMFVALFFVPNETDEATAAVLHSAKRSPLVGNADLGQAWVFKRGANPQDPASQAPLDGITWRRPTRDDPAPVPDGRNPSPDPGDLNVYREPITLPGAPHVPLEDPGRFEVRESRFVYAEGSSDKIKKVRLPANGETIRPRLRSHDFSAISAYHSVKSVLDHVERLGIVLGDYFKAARLPLRVHYRSGVRPGPGKDGVTVNARVLPRGWDPKDIGPRCDNPELDVHLAMASLSHRERPVWNRKDRSQAE